MFDEIILTKSSSIALINKSEEINYEQLISAITHRSKVLKDQGIRPGDHVGIYLKDSFEFLVSYIALWNLKATVALFDIQLNLVTLGNLVSVSEIKYLITQDSSCLHYSHRGELSSNSHLLTINRNSDTALNRTFSDYKGGFIILFTSGSEGFPKPVVLKKTAILNNISKVISYLNLQSYDKTILSLPLSYSYAMSHTLTHLLSGAKIAFGTQGYIVDNIINAMEEGAITNYAATPYFFESLVEKLEKSPKAVTNLRTLRILMSAGGYLKPGVIQRICQILPQIDFYNNYGQTEASPRLTYARFDSRSKVYEGVGRPISGVDIRIDTLPNEETGEVLYRSEDIMLGYYGNFNLSGTDEWFRTGDVGVLKNGDLLIAGRKDDMIKINGRKVYLNKIEEVMFQLEDIHQIKLVKQKHNLYGEYLSAFIVPSEIHQTDSEIMKRIKSGMKKLLAPSERPQKIYIKREIKFSSNGKAIREAI